MASLTHGMNVEQVEQLGRFLQERAGAIDAMTKELESRVAQSTWLGPDADRYRNDWWPGHRNQLASMAETLRGFGQSALNNAAEQIRASDAGAGTVAGPGGGMTGGAAAVGGAAGGAPGNVGSGVGALAGSERSWQQVDEAYRNGMTGPYGAGGDYEYQCTAWANYRWRELGYEGPMVNGHGKAMAANAGGSTTTPPTLGAMASYGSDQYGHVMIVEEVYADGRFRVSEMNMGGDGVEASADEYRSNRIFTPGPNGTWLDARGRSVGPITIAPLPR